MLDPASSHQHLAFLGDRPRSTLSPASPSSISLWALPDGIIGKQFSFWSTTQSKITGLSTSIISLIASSSSAGFSQRMPTA